MHDPFVSIDDSNNLRPYSGYKFITQGASVSTMQIADIVEKESGAEAKKKVVESINKQNKKTIKELVKAGISKQSEEQKLAVNQKKTGTIKKEAVQVTTKIVKTPRSARASKDSNKQSKSSDKCSSNKAPKSKTDTKKSGSGKQKAKTTG